MRCDRRDPATDLTHRPDLDRSGDDVEPPGPSPGFRRRAWREFQRAIDPLATPKPLPRPWRR